MVRHESNIFLCGHRRTGPGGGGGGAGGMQPPKFWATQIFLGRKRNLGKARF